MRRLLITTALAATLALGGWVLGRSSIAATLSGPRAPANASPSQPCTRVCRSAYEVIAKALPHDHGNVLARAILSTSGLSYAQLTRALHIPTTTEIRAQWRHYCDTQFPNQPRAARACFELIIYGAVNTLVIRTPRPKAGSA
jgi:hypothetical protein